MRLVNEWFGIRVWMSIVVRLSDSSPTISCAAAVISRGDIGDPDRSAVSAGEVRSNPGGDLCQTRGSLAGDLPRLSRWRPDPLVDRGRMGYTVSGDRRWRFLRTHSKHSGVHQIRCVASVPYSSGVLRNDGRNGLIPPPSGEFGGD